jgi:hypothetical protein
METMLDDKAVRSEESNESGSKSESEDDEEPTSSIACRRSIINLGAF